MPLLFLRIFPAVRDDAVNFGRVQYLTATDTLYGADDGGRWTARGRHLTWADRRCYRLGLSLDRPATVRPAATKPFDLRACRRCAGGRVAAAEPLIARLERHGGRNQLFFNATR